MTRVEEFDTFYDSTRRHLLHLTYALCGDRNVATAAVTEAYERAWQHWSKLRTQDSVAYLRNEAWRLSLFERGTHPWRRRHEEDSDLALITALQRLSQGSRRLIVLQTLAEVSLETAARDVGWTDEVAVHATEEAIGDLEATLSAGLDDIERRLRDLGRVTQRVTLPRASSIRRRSRSRTRRNTLVGVATATVVVVGAGLLSTQHAPMNRADASPGREQIGAETPTVADPTRGIGVDRLLDSTQMTVLDPTAGWSVASTTTDSAEARPTSVCVPDRTPGRRAAKVLVRTYAAAGTTHETSRQAIEVSHTTDASTRAYDEMVRAYADCSDPRVQLVDNWTVNQPSGPTQILQLRSWAAPTRTITVAITHAGAAMTVLEHEVDGTTGPNIARFAQVSSESIRMVCADAGGACPTSASAVPALPPATSHDKAFLGVIDLPPVSTVDDAWAGTTVTSADPNPAATLCDDAAFDGKRVQSARSRVFVIPASKQLPKQFGVAETIARFDRPKDASRFVATVGAAIDRCPKSNLSASLDQESTVKSPGIRGRTWRVTFEVDANTRAYYRVALVRRGRDVAQVTMSPTKAFDVAPPTFQAVAERAAARLAYLD